MARAEPALPGHPSRFGLLALIGLLAISATGALRYYLRTPDLAESARHAKLAKIVGKHRLARARLSGGFAYSKCESDSSADRLVQGLVCSGPPPTAWGSADDLRAFAGELRTGGQTGSASSFAHMSGLWALVWGRTDDAVASLREAARQDPSNAHALNDLAVALTEDAQKRDDPSALIDAFVVADSAVRLDGSLREAQFTLAVLLEKLYLRSDALAAWKRYLELDSRSPWAGEARERLTALAPREDKWKESQERLLRAVAKSDVQTIRSIVADNPSNTRELVQKQLGDWGQAFVRGDSAGGSVQLDVARALVKPLRAATGDALMSDAIAAIDRALSEKDGRRVRALAEGHAALENGLQQFRLAKPAVARAELARARTLLSEAKSPMRGWALLNEARTRIQEAQDSAYASALALLTAVRDSTPKNYLVLRSFAAQFQGFVYDVRADYIHMIAAYDSALRDGRTTQEPQTSLRVGSWLAQAEGVLRGKQAGWRRRYAVLAATPRHHAAYQPLYSAFDYAALATASEAPRLSLRYCDELIRIARELSDPNTLAYALRRRAEQLERMGQTGRARDDIAAALEAARRVGDATGREKLIADVTLIGSRLALRSSPTEAQAGLRRVITEYQTVKYDKGLSAAYLYLAQSRAGTGAIDSARVAFDSATSLMRRQRATVSNYAERGTFLDGARAVIDQVVAFHAGNSARDAFEYFEQNRSRVLLEQLAGERERSAESPRPVLAALQDHLTNDDIVLSYAVLPRELLIWTIGRHRFEQHRVPTIASDLEGLVNRFRRSVVDAEGDIDVRIAERLYQILIDSAGPIAANANVIVIPDRWLHFVPFAALRDPGTGHFMVREHTVSFTPSAALLISRVGGARERFSATSRVLAIGNPAFDRQEYVLPDLPAADGEARRVAALYSDRSTLIGREASDAALERSVPTYDILHFAGHAVVGRDAPQLSHLVLASDGRSDGVVFSTEIAQWKLSRTRLVVLSGCSTADGKLSATEGASSLARAFFAAGVPAVISSLWAIDDEDTAEFFVAFHRRLVRGVPASVALRETQIEWLGDGPKSARPIRSWAAFQLFGR